MNKRLIAVWMLGALVLAVGCAQTTRTEHLVTQIGGEDPAQAAEAKQTLLNRGPEAIPELRSLALAREDLRRDAVALLANIADAYPDTAARVADALVNVVPVATGKTRELALYHLRRIGSAALPAVVRLGITAEDEQDRLAGIAVATLIDKNAMIGELIAMLEKGAGATATPRIISALRSNTRLYFGYDPENPAAKNQEAIRGWIGWWAGKQPA